MKLPRTQHATINIEKLNGYNPRARARWIDSVVLPSEKKKEITVCSRHTHTLFCAEHAMIYGHEHHSSPSTPKIADER